MTAPSRRSDGAARGPTRRSLGGVLASAALGICGRSSPAGAAAAEVNAPCCYKVREFGRPLACVVDAAKDLGPIDRRIFGTNLEWFNEAGGLDSPDAALRERLVDLACGQKLSTLRFPGGTLADYYDWRDGIGPRERRPARRHPTDPGISANGFGSPEYFGLLQRTGAEGLITVNAGTGTPQDAAAWVAYANQPGHQGRRADGYPEPAGIKLWEVGNELYLPGNPGERRITQTPETYAANFIAFADAIRQADPTVTVIAIAPATSHAGPASQFPDWTGKLLAAAAAKIDMVAVHNAYFPLLYGVRQPPVAQVYPALWAAPEAVDRSLASIEALIGRHENDRRIGIALTEWGALFSLPTVDPYWVDHVKTLGTGVYVARLLQVLISHSRVQLANYFKFADRSFMGWVGWDGKPKVPYWVFRLFAEATGARRVAASVDSPSYDAPALGVMLAEPNVPEVTVVASYTRDTGAMYINFVNRSMRTAYGIRLRVSGGPAATHGEVRSVSAAEPTAHNGADLPDWPMRPEYEPYTTAQAGSIRIETRPWSADQMLRLPPFSVATLVLASAAGTQ